MNKKIVDLFVISLLLFFISGCTTVPVVQPTYHEMQATRAHKKTAAILVIATEGSAVTGISSIARYKIENNLMRHFNLVEREKIEDVLAERKFSYRVDVERYSEIGKMLGADLVVFGNTKAALNVPEIKHHEHKYESGKFRGKIWEENCAQAEVGLKIVNVSDGIIVFSGSKSYRRCQRSHKERFKDEALFQETLKTKTNDNHFIEIAERFGALRKGYANIISQAINEAAKKLTVDMKSFVAQTGQIMRFVNKKDVVVNLGSAYGIKPGDILIVWRKGQSFTDPKTGVVTVPKEKKAYLKVIRVTSGLSSIARITGSVNGVLNEGDTVYTQR